MKGKQLLHRLLLFVGVIWWGGTTGVAAQQVAVKTNLLYWATSTPNVGAEFGLGDRTTLDVSFGYNPWTLNRAENRKVRHVLVMPEFRYWLCESFRGHFFGLHTGYTYYNISGVGIPFHSGTRGSRYQGWATGLGLSYGYSWVLGRRWNLEATVGLGYVYTDYRKYDCVTCGDYLGRQSKHLFTPTKAGITLIYRIK